MDPRLTPPPANRNPRVVQDVKTTLNRSGPPPNPFTGMTHTTPAPVPKPATPTFPAARATSASPSSDAPKSFRPEVVASIPVATPGKAASPAVPVPVNKPHDDNQDDDLDKILEAVNNRVKAPVPATAKTKVPGAIAQKVKAGGGKVKDKVGTSKPLGALVATVLVALMLAATAVFAYRQGATTKVGASVPKVGTTSSASNSIQDAGNLLVRPSDLDDFSQTLQTKIDGLNDSQDFTQQPLSDQMLGL